MHDIPVSRIMTTRPATVAPDDSIATARGLLESCGIHHLPVVDNGRLVGVVSSSDMLKLHLLDGGAEATPAAGMPVRQIMEPDPVTLDSRSTLRDAIERLSIGGYHALPVVTADRHLVGILTTGDLLTRLLQQIPRGDGSLRASAAPGGGAGGGDADAVLREAFDVAGRSAHEAADAALLARALLALRERTRLLERVCEAADIYLRSGEGAREHSVLTKRLQRLRETPSTRA